MQKIKSLKINTLLIILKCSLIGIVSTLVGTIIFAVVLKFTNFSLTLISYVNDIIKAFSIFIMITCVKKRSGEKLFLKSILAGLIYFILSFFIFSILNGSINFNISFVYDLLFSIVVSVIVSVIINILNKNA